MCEQQTFWQDHMQEQGCLSIHPFYNYTPTVYTHSTITLLQFTPILQLHSYSLHPFYNYTPTVYTHSTITLLQFTPILQLHSHSLHPLYNYTPTVYTHYTITLPQFNTLVQHDLQVFFSNPLCLVHTNGALMAL